MAVLEKFHHQITGPSSGPKLVFLHGVLGFAANWRTIAKAFESEFQVLAFDQRGHGRSFKPAVGYSPRDYATDLLDIIDELGWSRIHLVGHSMGGRNALQFAIDHPERVERLVIEDIGPTINRTGSDFIFRLLDAIPVPFPSKREAKAFFETTFLEIFKDTAKKEGLAAYLYANIVEDEQKRGVWRFFEPGMRESVEQGRAGERWNEIGSLEMPTLLIRGEYSKDLPRDVYERILRENPRIQGVEIQGAGHWVHSDQPEAFIAALRSFFGA